MNLKMIAKEAGVSVMTVSNVINGKYGKVSDKTRERIEAIIEKYNYTPNQNARTLVGAKSRLIGMILNVNEDGYIDNPYYCNLIGMFESRLGKHDYFLLVKSIGSMREAVSVINTWNVEGVIFVGLFEENVQLIKDEINIPFICIDTFVNLEGVSCISADDAQGGYEATKYLIANGHEKILFVSPKININGVVKERYDGYCRALREACLIQEMQVLEVNRCTVEEGEQLAQRIVELGVTAVFATADILAIGIMKGLEALGKCVPDDVSVIGFDNLDVSNLVTPSLTSINQQVPQKVDVAIETLLEMLNGQTLAGKTVKIKPDIVYRESVKKLNK